MDDTAIDHDAMGRIARALTFILGAEHPTTKALAAAADGGSAAQVKKARGMFLKLKPGERQAAMAMLDDD